MAHSFCSPVTTGAARLFVLSMKAAVHREWRHERYPDHTSLAIALFMNHNTFTIQSEVNMNERSGRV